MKDIKRYWGVFAIVLVALLSSCGSSKSYTYLQDVELMKRYTVEHNQDIRVSAGDRVAIYVGSAFPELAEPFNGGGYPKMSVGAASAGATAGQNEQNKRELQNIGFLVEQDGTINYPILGRIQIAGLTTEEVSRLIERKILESKSLTDPRVSTVITNFQIFLLGAVAGQGEGNASGGSNSSTAQNTAFTRLPGVQGGVLKVYDRQRLNILEALAMTGDLPQRARVSHVNVLRKADSGAYITYRLNLKSADLFYSPAFNLQQNDIVYVEYRYRRTQSLDRAMQLSGYFFSTVASVAALVALLKK